MLFFPKWMYREYAAHYQLAMTSGSDIHNTNRLAKGGILTDCPIQTPEDLTSILRGGAYRLIENP